MNEHHEHVLRSISDHDVRFVRLWFTDVTGTLKSVAIAPGEVESAFAHGIGFDGSAIEGLTRVTEADMVLRPDASTFQILPWREGDEVSARMFCDITTPDGEPARTDPRAVLRRALAHAENLGFTFHVHPEVEFYLFHPVADERAPLVPIDQGSYFDHISRPVAQSFRSEAVRTLEQMGIAVEFSHHEAGPGQNEIDLRVADGLTMADNVMTLRTVVHTVAIASGVHASFMPKPMIEHPGSGMHTHMSLFEGDTNAFYDPAERYQLSVTGQRFTAGILRHAREIAAVTNQHVNSYKRLWAGDEAPCHIAWGNHNRSALVRVPSFSAKDGHSARIEFRALDPAANPYLAYAVLLEAGLAGIEGEYELSDPLDTDAFSLTDLERRVMGIPSLPRSLDEAIGVMQESELVARTLGEQTFEFVLRNKRHEWESYRYQVTEAERRQFQGL